MEKKLYFDLYQKEVLMMKNGKVTGLRKFCVTVK